LSEACVQGLPLISSLRAGASYHLIKDGKNGVLLEDTTPDQLEAAMLRYCDQPSLIREHGRESRLIIKDYTAQANVHRMESALLNKLS
jgi:glycosyltransferase involved in cell wall biosynthesis